MNSKLILRNCSAVDERGARENFVDIYIRGERIVEIASCGSGSAACDGYRVVDLEGATVIPGFVNMHEHLCAAHPSSLEEKAIEGDDDAMWVARMIGNAQKALGVGVTSMRLVGEKGGLDFKVREAAGRRLFAGPRLWTAGAAIDFKGGHAANVGSLEGETPEEYRAFADSQVRLGADLLKLMICGSGTWGDLDRVRMTLDDFLAVRSAAREANLKIAVHTSAVNHPIMDQLVDDGIDSLEHCYLIPDELLARCIQRGILLVMTPLVSQSPEYYESIQLPPQWVDCMRETAKRHWPVVCKAVKQHARLALGTDFHSHLEFAGTSAVARELELYEEAGATITQLLSLSSRTGAEWLGMGNELGLVEEGFLADLVVLEDDLLSKGAIAFRGLRHVISRGYVVAPIPPEPPLHP